MFKVDPTGTQQMFDSMGSEPEIKEILDSNSGEPIKYYVYNLKD
jgi:hypothetical protein